MFSQSSVNIPAALILILLSVLQVKVDCKPAGQTVVKQTCSTPCWPEGNCYYSWYRYPGSWNREIIGCSYGATVWFISTSSSDQDRYYCEVQNGAAPQQKCKLDWAVIYTPGRVCGLKGSSVDLSCSYKHPEGLTVKRSLWYIESQWKFGAEPEDVRRSDQYEGRVQYSRTLNSSRMTITDLRESDAHTYSFRFYTEDPDGRYSGRPGVTLSVTDLKVTVSDTDGGVKKLTCSSTCTLPNNPTYIWYRNGQPVSDQNRNELELRDRTVDAGSYSCAVKGYEELGSPAVYSPRPPSVSETEVNGSVTLVCVSDSTPASSYTWFRKTGGNITQFGEGASLTLAAGADGVFYCTAENPYGSSTSSEWTLTSGVLWDVMLPFYQTISQKSGLLC
uniref:Ig-like domain-containing protein n=1 Tax=Pygocentrus nattereri TaxID=42514 RepID=A0AAR2J004_PYGNA